MRFPSLVITGLLLAGCGVPGSDVRRFPGSGDATFPARRGTVLVMGCSLDAGQRATLANDDVRHVVSEVELFCLAAGDGGVIAPTDPSEAAAARATAADVRAMGYEVTFGLVIGDAWSAPYPADRAGALLADTKAVNAIPAALAPFAASVDHIDVAPWPLPTSARSDAVTFVATVGAGLPKGVSLSVQVPPSATDPSDLFDGEAFDVAALGSIAGRVRVMTLDYSDPSAPGPTTDPGWAVAAYRLAHGKATGAAFDVALPLYGWDFTNGVATSITWADSIALARAHGAPITRGPSGVPRSSFDDGGAHHELVCDDAQSLTLDLGAWDPDTLPRDVGVLYWGLGAEDPGLWAAIRGGAR
jgi:hypothetical protein